MTSSGDEMTIKPSKQELQRLAQEIKQDQAKVSPAEKRVKIKSTFKKAIKKMGRMPLPKKDSK
jgi:hypothetical protein